MKSRLIYFYVLSLPFTSALSFFGGRLTFTVILSICMLAIICIHLLVGNDVSKRENIYYGKTVIVFFIYIGVIFLLNGIYVEKAFMHSASYIASVTLFLIIPLLFGKYFNKYIKNEKLFKYIFIMVFYSSIYAFLEFVFINWFGIDLNNYITWGGVHIKEAAFLGSYYRARGFAVEAGHYALFLECFIPLVFYYLFVSGYSHLRKMFKIFSFTIIVFSLLFTVSAAAFVIIPVAIMISLTLNFKNFFKIKKIFSKKILVLVLAVVIVILLLKNILPIYDMIFTSTIGKLNSTSSTERLIRLNVFSNLIENANLFAILFGYGPGATSIMGLGGLSTIIFLYPLVLIELGLVGFLIFLLLLIQFFIKSKKLNKNLIFYFQISLFSLYLHYLFIGDYWYPFLWFLGALPYLIRTDR